MHHGTFQSTKRSIPAWAGKPPNWSRSSEYEMVYPRVGGETPVKLYRQYREMGLSPRGRGNLSAM